VLGGVLAALVALAVFTGFLNYFYRAERAKRAERYFQAGAELAQNERFAEAVEQYRNALSIAHDFRSRLALGLALLKAERRNEAAIYLNEALREHPANGPAQLGAATIEAAEGQVESAILHYHRAIVGSWPENAAEKRALAQIQLVEYLAKIGRRAQARAELLALAANLPNDGTVQKQIGRMLVAFGLGREAVDLFSALIREGPSDAGEYDELGAAHFAMADYRSAREAFRSARKINPADQTAVRQAELCDRILALDPTDRRIGSRERFRRSVELLRDVFTQLSACAPDQSGWPPQTKDAATAALTSLSQKRAPASFSDAAESNLALSETLWAERLRSCGSPAPDDPIALLMVKLAGTSSKSR
jgi:tetratricopeptide (TPR) repeat protein